jgi:hypothetical protein
LPVDGESYVFCKTYFELITPVHIPFCEVREIAICCQSEN